MHCRDPVDNTMCGRLVRRALTTSERSCARQQAAWFRSRLTTYVSHQYCTCEAFTRSDQASPDRRHGIACPLYRNPIARTGIPSTGYYTRACSPLALQPSCACLWYMVRCFLLGGDMHTVRS